jgi:serine/threonine protein kinase/WD40 repeat protein
MNSQSENCESSSVSLQIDLLCDRFEMVLRSGSAPDFSTYLLEVDESFRPLALRELLWVELEMRRTRGESPRLDEYEQRYPEYATILAGIIQSDERRELESIVTPRMSFGGERPVEECTQKILGDFRLIRELGSGGMGLVYEAEQLSMGRRVALKVLPFAALVQDKLLQRFHNEVRAAASLDHPHIVSIYSVGEERGVHFFAMQLIRGQTLADAITQLRNAELVKSRPEILPIESPLLTVDGQQADKQARQVAAVGKSSPTKKEQQVRITTHGGSHQVAEFYRWAARLGIQASEALQHAHELGVQHRDIKPSNLMLDGEGQLYIADFGLARIEADAGVTLPGDIIGTLRYMAPEQALAKREIVDYRADIYSLGATLYELLTLQPAFGETDRSELLKQIAFEEPRPLRKLDHHIPVELETIVLKAMAKTPEDRYQTSQRLADDLRAFLENRPIQAQPASFADFVRKWSKRHQVLVRTAGLALVLLTGVLAVSIALVKRAQTQAVTALQETSELLYTADMTVAYQTFEKGWSDDVQSILDRHRPSGRDPDRRGLEWHLLQRFVQQPVPITLAGHRGTVNEIAVFPDRRRLASVGEDGKLRIWDIRSRKLLQTIPICDQELHSVAISPDGRFVASGNIVLYFCDLERGNQVTERFNNVTSIESLVFSADGKHLVAGSRYEEVCLLSMEGRVENRIPCGSRVESLDYVTGSSLLLVPNRRTISDQSQLGIVQLWDDGLFHVEQEFDGSRRDRPAKFSIARSSPCGKYVAAGEGYGSTASIIELASGNVVAETPISRDQLTDLSYSPDGQAIAIGYQHGRVEYFELHPDANGKPSINRRPLVVNAHRGGVRSVRFVDAKTLASCGNDGLVRIWKVPNKHAQSFDLTDSHLNSLELSPDGSRLLYASRDELFIVNVDSHEVVYRLSHPDANYREPVWSAAGDKAAFICGYSASVSILDHSGQSLCSISHGIDPEAAAFSPDGSLVAVIGAQQMQLCRSDNGQQLFRQSLSQPGTDISFSHDGMLLAYGGHFGAVVTFDVSKREPLRELACSSYASCVAFSPDDSLLATAHADSVIRLWDVQSGQLRFELIGHERAANDLAFSPDGHTLLSSANDGSIRVWSVDHGCGYGFIYRRFEPGTINAWCRLSLSSDGRRLAAGYATQQEDCPDVLLWQIDSSDSNSSTN